MHVLLALTSGELHGYGILLEVERQAQGVYKMGPGTLYASLKKLLSQGLVQEVQAADDIQTPRRKYHLTELGAAVLRAETERLSKVLKEAHQCLRLYGRTAS